MVGGIYKTTMVLKQGSYHSIHWPTKMKSKMASSFFREVRRVTLPGNEKFSSDIVGGKLVVPTHP